MIETIKYINNQQTNAYLALVEEKYSQVEYFAYYFFDIKNALQYSLLNEHQQVYFIKAITNQKLLGHVALILDSRFSKNEALFGFFECEDRIETFTGLWKELKRLCKEHSITKLAGPINGSIWHSYRVVVPFESNYPHFLSDMLSEPHSYEFLKQEKPQAEIGYYSGLRRETSTLIHYLAPSFNALLNTGVSIEKLEIIGRKELETFFEISQKTFQNSWKMVELKLDEFMQLYNSTKVDNYISCIYVAKWQDTIIGFCTILQHADKWILKTMAIIPKYQEKGIGNALVYKIHSDAKALGVKEMIYALIRDGNKIKHFPKDDAVEIRKYACFEFEIEL